MLEKALFLIILLVHDNMSETGQERPSKRKKAYVYIKELKWKSLIYLEPIV